MSARDEWFLVYLEERVDGVARGTVMRGEGDDVEHLDFEVDDLEPADVFGPILSRIAEETLGLSGSPDHMDGGPVGPHDIVVGIAVLEIEHDGTPA